MSTFLLKTCVTRAPLKTCMLSQTMLLRRTSFCVCARNQQKLSSIYCGIFDEVRCRRLQLLCTPNDVKECYITYIQNQSKVWNNRFVYVNVVKCPEKKLFLIIIFYVLGYFFVCQHSSMATHFLCIAWQPNVFQWICIALFTIKMTWYLIYMVLQQNLL